MTFERLLGYTAAELNSMPPEEWQKMLDPFLHITRPERAVKVTSVTGQKVSTKAKTQFDAAQAMLDGLGIDLQL